jgi:hypothetical protein
MDNIYKNANFVLVWLGSANDNTPKVIRMIDQLSTACQSRTPEELAALLDPLDPETQKILGLEDLTIEAWLALYLFFRRTWFSRLWTIQEATLARDIVCRCGTYTTPWVSVENIYINSGVILLLERSSRTLPTTSDTTFEKPVKVFL